MKRTGYGTRYCLYEDTVFYQRFERGFIVGPVRIDEGDDDSQQIAIFDETAEQATFRQRMLYRQPPPACQRAFKD